MNLRSSFVSPPNIPPVPSWLDESLGRDFFVGLVPHTQLCLVIENVPFGWLTAPKHLRIDLEEEREVPSSSLVWELTSGHV